MMREGDFFQKGLPFVLFHKIFRKKEISNFDLAGRRGEALGGALGETSCKKFPLKPLQELLNKIGKADTKAIFLYLATSDLNWGSPRTTRKRVGCKGQICFVNVAAVPRRRPLPGLCVAEKLGFSGELTASEGLPLRGGSRRRRVVRCSRPQTAFSFAFQRVFAFLHLIRHASRATFPSRGRLGLCAAQTHRQIKI